MKSHKKYLKGFLIMSTAIAMLSSTACSNPLDKKPDEDMVLKLHAEQRIVDSGSIQGVWNQDSMSYSLLYSNLFIEDPLTQEIKPDLAESYNISEDGLIYEFVLKDNLLWSDGKTLDMEDVVFSFHNIILAYNSNPIFLTAFNIIEGAEEYVNGQADSISGIVTDGNKITITLEKPVVTFMKVMAQFSILPEHCINGENMDTFNIESEFWKNPVCSGMYKINKFNIGESMEFVYNENYHGEVPYINSIILSPNFTPEELDFYEANDISQILDYRAITNKIENKTNTLFYRYFVFNIQKLGEIDPVMNDIRVRQAIINAIDRDALLKDIYYNTGSLVENEEWLQDREDNGFDYSYNPELSKQLLIEAEYDFDRPLVILCYYSDDTSKKFMNSVGKYLEEVGFTVEIVTGGHLYNPEFDYYDIALKGLSAFDVSEWYNEYDESHQLHTTVFGGEPMFDDLIEQLISTTNQEDKDKVLAEMRTRSDELLYKYPLFTLDFMTYINKNTLELPEGVVFGNPRYGYDIDFENWKIKE